MGKQARDRDPQKMLEIQETETELWDCLGRDASECGSFRTYCQVRTTGGRKLLESLGSWVRTEMFYHLAPCREDFSAAPFSCIALFT
jgi:hypothetical protein